MRIVGKILAARRRKNNLTTLEIKSEAKIKIIALKRNKIFVKSEIRQNTRHAYVPFETRMRLSIKKKSSLKIDRTLQRIYN